MHIAGMTSCPVTAEFARSVLHDCLLPSSISSLTKRSWTVRVDGSIGLLKSEFSVDGTTLSNGTDGSENRSECDSGVPVEVGDLPPKRAMLY